MSTALATQVQDGGTKVETPADPVAAAAPAKPIEGASAEQFQPDQKWREMIPEDLREQATFKNLKSPTDAYKMLAHAQSLVGRDKIVVPNEKTTDDEWKEIYQKLGVPEEQAKYVESIKLPEGMEKDTEFMTQFMDQAHKMGIRPAQAEKLLGWYKGISDEAVAAADKAQKGQAGEVVSKLQREWGKSWDSNLQMTKKGLRAIFGQQEGDKIINDPVLGNNPTFIRFAHKIATMVTEDKLRGSDGSPDPSIMSPKAADQKIKSIMSDPKHPYMLKDHPLHKTAIEEMSRLFEMRNP